MKTGLYRHFKGGLYEVLYTARFNTTITVPEDEDVGTFVKYNPNFLDGMEVAVYIEVKGGAIHVRPVSEFSDFVLDPNAPRSIVRFEYLGDDKCVSCGRPRNDHLVRHMFVPPERT